MIDPCYDKHIHGPPDLSRVTNICEKYLIEEDKFLEIEPMNVRRYGFGAAAHSHKIYVAGGNEGVKNLSSVEVYHIKYDQWQILTSMKVPRNFCRMAVVGEKLIVIGGRSGRWSFRSKTADTPSTTEWYHIESNTWTPGPKMTTKRCAFAVATVKVEKSVLEELQQNSEESSE